MQVEDEDGGSSWLLGHAQPKPPTLNIYRDPERLPMDTCHLTSPITRLVRDQLGIAVVAGVESYLLLPVISTLDLEATDLMHDTTIVSVAATFLSLVLNTPPRESRLCAEPWSRTVFLCSHLWQASDPSSASLDASHRSTPIFQVGQEPEDLANRVDHVLQGSLKHYSSLPERAQGIAQPADDADSLYGLLLDSLEMTTTESSITNDDPDRLPVLRRAKEELFGLLGAQNSQFLQSMFECDLGSIEHQIKAAEAQRDLVQRLEKRMSVLQRVRDSTANVIQHHRHRSSKMKAIADKLRTDLLEMTRNFVAELEKEQA